MARASITALLLLVLGEAVERQERQQVAVAVGHDATLSITDGTRRKTSSLVRRAERHTEEQRTEDTEEQRPDDVLRNDPHGDNGEQRPDDVLRSDPRGDEGERRRPSAREGEEERRRPRAEEPTHGSSDDIFSDPIFKTHGRREPYDTSYDHPREGDYTDEARYHQGGRGHNRREDDSYRYRRGEDERGDGGYERRPRGDDFGDDRFDRDADYGWEPDFERERERERAGENPYDGFGEDYRPRRHTTAGYMGGPESAEEMAVKEAKKVEKVIDIAEKRAGLSPAKLAPQMPSSNLADNEEFSLAWLGCIFVVAAGGFMLGWRMRKPDAATAQRPAERGEGQRDDEGEQSSLSAPHAAGDSR